MSTNLNFAIDCFQIVKVIQFQMSNKSSGDSLKLKFVFLVLPKYSYRVENKPKCLSKGFVTWFETKFDSFCIPGIVLKFFLSLIYFLVFLFQRNFSKINLLSSSWES